MGAAFPCQTPIPETNHVPEPKDSCPEADIDPTMKLQLFVRAPVQVTVLTLVPIFGFIVSRPPAWSSHISQRMQHVPQTLASAWGTSRGIDLVGQHAKRPNMKARARKVASFSFAGIVLAEGYEPGSNRGDCGPPILVDPILTINFG